MITTPKAITQCHELLRWIIPLLDRFPRARRYTLGQKLEMGLLEVLQDLTEAAYRKQGKAGVLDRANRRLQGLRHLWRLAFELQIISSKRYRHGAEQLVDIGSQIGGWGRSCR